MTSPPPPSTYREALTRPVQREEVSHEHCDPTLSYDPSIFPKVDIEKLFRKGNYMYESDEDEDESDHCGGANCGGANFNDETDEDLDEDEDEDADPEFAEVKRKIRLLKARGWRGIRFFAESMASAYDCLILDYDPRGFRIQFRDEIRSIDCEFDMQYLKLLRRLDESEQIKFQSDNIRCANLENLEKLISDLPRISADVAMYACFQDYIEIYVPREVFTHWNLMHDYLFNSVSNSKEEYLEDPNSFKHKLKESFPFASWHFDYVYNAVTKWWTSKSEELQEGRIAKSIVDFALKRAQENCEGRLKSYYTRGDYFKLKLEFARRVGIIKEMPGFPHLHWRAQSKLAHLLVPPPASANFLKTR